MPTSQASFKTIYLLTEFVVWLGLFGHELFYNYTILDSFIILRSSLMSLPPQTDPARDTSSEQ